MTNADGNQTTPAGWYADPAGSPQLRWWDGSGWTDHLQPAVQAPVAQTPAAPAPQPSYGQAAAIPSAPAYAYPAAVTAAHQKVPAGTPAYGPVIWVITLLPLISLLLLPLSLTDIEGTVRSAAADRYGTGLYGGYSTAGLVGQLLATLAGWLIAAAIIVLAYVDHRWLRRTGYAQPFHWAWSFFALIFPPLYTIGRSIVVQRRSGRGLAPLWVAIGVFAVSLVIGIVLVIYVFNLTFSVMSSGGYGNLS